MSALPEMQKGNVRIQKEILRNDIRSPDGAYTYLKEGDHPWMHDHKFEIVTMGIPFMNEAHGNVLTTGLGLGIVLTMAKDCPRIKSIEVLEKNQDVIDLVSPFFPDTKVIQGDAWEYVPDKVYDYIWHDFDSGILNLEGQEKIMKRYEPYARQQNCWLYDAFKRGLNPFEMSPDEYVAKVYS